jgi:hypothetical protein
MRSVNVLKLVALALVTSIGLAGCMAPEETTPEPIASAEPQFTFYPSGSASSNLPIFENILAVTGSGKPNHNLSDSISLLVDTGFDLEAISHTPENSKIGEPADSVSLAVEFGGECLIAQFSSSWMTVTIAQPTVSGCLIGDVEKAALESN